MEKQVVPMTTVLPITVEGSVLAKLRNIFGNEAQIQETDIRVEHVLSPSSVSQKFNLNGNGTNQRPTEQFIGRNDLVVLYALMVGIQKVSKVTTAGNSGNYFTYTYPDKTVFPAPAAGVNVSEANALMAIYNGTISMKANTYEILNEERLNRFLHVPETQDSATTQAQLDSRRFKHIAQPAILSGRDTNILEFVPAEGADTTLISGANPDEEENVLVFHYKALVVRNAAQPATWSEMQAAAMKELTIDGKILI